MASASLEDNVTELFDDFCRHYSLISQELIEKSDDLKQSLSDKDVLINAKDGLQAECTILQETVEQCNKYLQYICRLEDEIRTLKNAAADREQDLCNKSAEHDAKLQEMEKTHREELDNTRSELQETHDQAINALKTELAKALASKLELEESLKQAQTEKEREVNRTIMEYENKLVRLQRQQTENQHQQQRMINQDIMRKKMHHMKEQSDREIKRLKAYIEKFETEQELKNTRDQLPTTELKSQVAEAGPSRQKRQRILSNISSKEK